MHDLVSTTLKRLFTDHVPCHGQPADGSMGARRPDVLAGLPASSLGRLHNAGGGAITIRAGIAGAASAPLEAAALPPGTGSPSRAALFWRSASGIGRPVAAAAKLDCRGRAGGAAGAVDVPTCSSLCRAFLVGGCADALPASNVHVALIISVRIRDTCVS